jgi:hypothetical protein
MVLEQDLQKYEKAKITEDAKLIKKQMSSALASMAELFMTDLWYEHYSDN